MGIKCQIFSELPEGGFYRSGQLIRGTVEYSIDKPMHIPYIVIFFKGKLKGKSNFIDRQVNKEIFVCENKVITEEKENITKAGDYKHSFECMLPSELPSSFRDNTCTISYKVSVEFTLQNGQVKQFQKEIPVYGDVSPYSVKPIAADVTKSPFPKLKPIDVEVKIKRPFVTAGTNIRLTCLIDNEADIPVSYIKTKLVEETTYNYDNKHNKVQRKTVDGSSSILMGAKGNSEAEIICVVPTSPNLYSIQHSKYFKRDYKVHVTATFPFPHKKVSMEVPVVIQADNDTEININAKHNSCFICC